MLCDIDTAGIARRDDALVISLAGGVAAYAGPDSPMNKIAGLGFGGHHPAPNRTPSGRASPCRTPARSS
ncbi:hypothetical protein HNP40_004011 [Mycobacteroides chelonae]|nr:hypothetical protein [Mycobacteroides chelonae]